MYIHVYQLLIYAYICMCGFMYRCICICIYTYNAYTITFVYMYIYIYTNTSTQIYIYIHIHTHIYMYVNNVYAYLYYIYIRVGQPSLQNNPKETERSPATRTPKKSNVKLHDTTHAHALNRTETRLFATYQGYKLDGALFCVAAPGLRMKAILNLRALKPCFKREVHFQWSPEKG